ncbi:STAS/SEC14 domain-containing protein [Saprospira sp. CCB-QB6]|uniref:DUF7793 family protein n=1 Tax=Saprospira sp. CCB-QB6 TaxID=3023936 RepID=UPI00234A5F9A|nr:STAS/SEC14 domain-containing protein [Saprospira sp. CCB-QB6]WCL81532.1 STAS/SEC14 domain-containing protein [Saprospira sp. CCB-QB6]
MQATNYKKEKIALASGYIYWPHGEPILEQVVSKNYTVGTQDANEIDQTIERMAAARGQAVYHLADIREIKGGSSEARKHFNEGPPACVKASAVLVSGAVSRLLGNFLIQLNHAHVPIRLFVDREEAIDWLLSQVEE